MQIGVNLNCIACKAFYPIAGKQQPPKPVPSLACPAGTFDPRDSPAPTCPQGTTCCCHKKKTFGIHHRCVERNCCFANQTCDDGHGCILR